MPFVMAYPLGVGILWGLPSYGSVDLGATTHGAQNWTSYASENIDFWVTTTGPASEAGPVTAAVDPAVGGPLAQMLSSYVDSVGHAVPMPDYVAGFWQCKNRYRNQTQLLDVANGYKSRGLPLDIITIDYMHWVHFG